MRDVTLIEFIKNKVSHKEAFKIECPKIPLCVICVHSYTLTLTLTLTLFMHTGRRNYSTFAAKMFHIWRRYPRLLGT